MTLSRLARARRPGHGLSIAICAAMVAAMGYLRLVLYPHDLVPLSYAIPLLVCLWIRDVRILWAMAACFVAMIFMKMFWIVPDDKLIPVTRATFAAMQVANVLIPAVTVHVVLALANRLEMTIVQLETSNAELDASNEELAAREEEVNQQNEELQTQAEELEQQTEELSSQTEELQTLNEQLAGRERTLGDLLEASIVGANEADVLTKIGQSLRRLLQPRGHGAAILEPRGNTMLVHPLFGLEGARETVKRERTLGEIVATRDRAGFLADVVLRPDIDLAGAVSEGPVRSVLAAPIRTDSSVSGAALEVYSARPGEWTEQELRLVQWAAEQYGRAWANSRLRQALAGQQQLLRTVTDTSSTALFLLNEQGVCAYANPAALAISGYSGEELGGSALETLLGAKASDAAATWPRGEFTLRRKSGERFTAECSANTTALAMGNGTGTVVEVRDASERKRASIEREQLLDSERAARAEAERAGRAKDEFVATLSHELRTPLNAVLGWATILKKGATGEDLAKGLDVIERNARHQSQLISDLLDMNRIVAGKIRLDVQAVDLPLVVEAAIDAVRPAAAAKEIRIERVIEPIDRSVSGDPNRLQQVVWNLLTNAVKFTPRGGRINVTLARVASYVSITVTDSGQGIAPEILPHVFERYRQADGSATRQQGGLGLGLAIVKHLIELHGGTVAAKSDGEGCGSSFSVLLPVRAVDVPDEIATRAHPASPSVLTLSSDAPTLQGLCIAVVDDEEDARAMLSRLLRDRGAEVETFASGDAALSAIPNAGFHLLVSDIGMPEMDGYTLIKRVRERGMGASELPAIALTAFARSEDRTRALLAGFQSHISKPVEPAELIATVVSLRPMIAFPKRGK